MKPTWTWTSSLTLTLTLTACTQPAPSPTDGGTNPMDGGMPDLALSSRWHVLRPPSPQQPNLFGLWGESTDHFYAAGSAGTLLRAEPDPAQPPLADGKPALRFSAVSSGTTRDLTAIHGTAANDVYAVGLGGTLLHFDGTAWTAETPVKAMPGDPAFTADLWGVFAYPGGALAVGQGGVWLQRVKGAWQPPQVLAVEALFGVWGRSDHDIYAVGSVGYVFHYDGAHWGVVSPAGFTQKLSGVFGGPGGVYAVGLGGSILRDSGGGFADYAAKIDPRCGTGAVPQAFLRHGVVSASGAVVIVGWEGTILRLFSGACAEAGMGNGVLDETGATLNRLEGLWSDSKSIYISGADGIVLRGQ